MADRVFVVTGIPDAKKGEKLVVLHTLETAAIRDLLAKLSSIGLPKLFTPKADAFVHVGELPMLGTGKLDLRACRAVAESSMRGEVVLS